MFPHEAVESPFQRDGEVGSKPAPADVWTTSATPIQDTICECVHWYDEHDYGTECQAPDCTCGRFLMSPALSTPAAIADRGGDPDLWPEHVKRALTR
jgi:hypothetical protein